MTSITITEIELSPTSLVGFYVEIAWRYGTTGTYTGVAPSAFVYPDGTLQTPLTITYDETIDPSIEVRVRYLNCETTTTYKVQVQDNTTSTSSTTSTSTTTTTTSTTTTTTIPPTTTT